LNFFGHAVAASWRGDSTRFALGAMLPDFASMLGARIEAVDEPEVSGGIAWHHLTDAAFHRLEAFRRWSRELTRRLAAAGASRGSSLAAGHVGVELLLDGVLVEREADLEPLYLGALDEIAAVDGRIRWRAAPAIGLDELAARLLSRGGLPLGYRDAAVVADRVIRVLARRPRLAMPVEQAPMLAAALTGLRAELVGEVDELLASLRQQLLGQCRVP
jgi:hypothetical protein